MTKLVNRASGKRLAEVQTAQQAAFLAAFRLHGTILHAALAAEVGRTTVYEWLKRDAVSPPHSAMLLMTSQISSNVRRSDAAWNESRSRCLATCRS